LNREPTPWVDRMELAIILFLQIAIAVVMVVAAAEQQWLTGFSGLAVLTLTFAPAMIERQLRVKLPVEFTLITCVFLYASFGLGEARDFYDRFWWWDLLLHGFSAIVLGLIGFLSIYVFYMTNRVRVKPVYVALITLALTISAGTLWEIFEFAADRVFATDMQKSGLNDTMTDLVTDAVGGVIAAAVGFYYVRNKDSLMGRRLIQRLLERGRKSGGQA
jgi:hypothetical protein